MKSKYYRPVGEFILVYLESKSEIMVPTTVSKSGLAQTAHHILFDAGEYAQRALAELGIEIGDRIFVNPPVHIDIKMEGKDFIQVSVNDVIGKYSPTKPALYEQFFKGSVGSDLQ